MAYSRLMQKQTKDLGQAWPCAGGAMGACSPHPCPELLTQCHWTSPGLRSHAAVKGLTSKGQNGTYPERCGTAMEIAATCGPMVRADTRICLKRLQDTSKSNQCSPATSSSYQSRIEHAQELPVFRVAF